MESQTSLFPPLPIEERTLLGRWSRRSCCRRGRGLGSGDHKLATVSWCYSYLVQCDVPCPSSTPLSFKHYLILYGKGNKNQSDVWNGEVYCEPMNVILSDTCEIKKVTTKMARSKTISDLPFGLISILSVIVFKNLARFSINE